MLSEIWDELSLLQFLAELDHFISFNSARPDFDYELQAFRVRQTQRLCRGHVAMKKNSASLSGHAWLSSSWMRRVNSASGSEDKSYMPPSYRA